MGWFIQENNLYILSQSSSTYYLTENAKFETKLKLLVNIKLLVVHFFFWKVHSLKIIWFYIYILKRKIIKVKFHWYYSIGTLVVSKNSIYYTFSLQRNALQYFSSPSQLHFQFQVSKSETIYINFFVFIIKLKWKIEFIKRNFTLIKNDQE